MKRKTKYEEQSDFEREISKKAKKDPKAFYKYFDSKLKTRSGISDLYKEDG